MLQCQVIARAWLGGYSGILSVAKQIICDCYISAEVLEMVAVVLLDGCCSISGGC